MLNLVDRQAPARELVRSLRSPQSSDGMPESIAWQAWIALKDRGEPSADQLFIGSVKRLHSRRCIAGSTLPANDNACNEHRLVEDGFLADLWKAYKKCIQNNRPGPASQLLRDIEERLQKIEA